MPTPLHEPHKIKTVRHISFPSLETRKKALAKVNFNVFHLTPAQVSFDMCSLGTSAVSQEQLSGQYIGDEAYAGSRNFEQLQRVVLDVLGHSYVCPTHNALGSIKLVLTTMVDAGSLVPGNATGLVDVLRPRDVRTASLRGDDELFTGNIRLDDLKEILSNGQVALVLVQAFADGQHPISLANLAEVRAITEQAGLRLLVDASRVIENAWFIQQHEPGQRTRSIAAIVKEFAKTAHIVHMDGAQDPKANIGGFLATDNPRDHEKFMNEVVVYEGLHTYGGMAGRTMELLARGLAEMCDEHEVEWVMHQTQRFTARLREGGVPLERGCDGAYIRTDAFLDHLEDNHQDAFSAALYLMSGVRAVAWGLVGRDNLVPVQLPRLAMTNDQLDQVADAIISLYAQRDKVRPLEVARSGRWRDQMSYRGVFGRFASYHFTTMPYLVHTTESVGRLSREERLKAIREAGYNTFLLRSADVTIDLLTDSGTAAMSTDQWSAYAAAIPTAATSDESLELQQVLGDALGYKHLLPTQQGRAAEHILSQIMIKPGQIVPGNMYFTTTKLHQEMAGGVFADIICDEAHQADSDFPWKGNIDLKKLEALVDEHGAAQIAYISFELSVNMAGGQPVSMDNMREVYRYCAARSIPVFFDATRMIENAYMIQKKDPGYVDTPVADILREMMAYGDGCTVSGKKDFIINIGGLLAFRDNDEWAAQAREMVRVWEGNITSGGLPSADLAAISQGAREMVEDRYIRARVEQTAFFGQLLLDGGVPIVTPPGSHAIFLDVKRFLPHIDQDQFPAQRLAAEIYVETGVRAMERGNVSKGRNPETGENYRPSLELVRLTIPRRVYSNDHFKAVADGIIDLYKRRDEITGLRFVYEPGKLRCFQSRFEPI